MTKTFIQSIRSLAGFSLAGALLFSASVSAHTVWLQPDTAPGVYRVYFGGHAGKIEGYDAAKLISVDAYDANGKRVDVVRTDAADGVRLKPASSPALIALHYDNGVHARTPEGRSVSKPMDEVPGSKFAVNAIKYHKTIVSWSAFVTQPLGQPLEVTPVEAKPPHAGQAMRLRITENGKPAAGIKIGRGEETAEGVSDDQGYVTFVPQKGFNKLWAGKRTVVKGNPRYTELSYEVLLGFDAE